MSNLDEISQAIGALQASDRMTRSEIRAMREDIAAMKRTIDQAKGGWRGLLMIGGVAGAGGAFLAKIIPWIGK